MMGVRSPLSVLTLLLGSAALPLLMGATAGLAQPVNAPNGNLALVGGTVYVSPTEDPIQDGAFTG